MIVTVLLGHVVSVVLNHSASVDMQERGLALLTAQRFVERIRADTDFAGLYARLRPGTAESAGDVGLTRLGPDQALTAFDASTYYADFTAPATLGTTQILVQVPVGTVAGVAALRENLVAPRYGLPADLNGDGAVDGASRDADYMALPVVVRLRCGRPGRRTCEVVLATWIRSGE